MTYGASSMMSACRKSIPTGAKCDQSGTNKVGLCSVISSSAYVLFYRLRKQTGQDAAAAEDGESNSLSPAPFAYAELLLRRELADVVARSF